MEQEFLESIDVEKAQKIQFINKKSEEIFYKKDHLFIGLSPSNSYYSEQRITEILFWVLKQEFKDFTVFLADEISYYNWLGKGYNEIAAKRRTREEDNKIRNRLYRAIEKLSISETKILKFSVLKESIFYKEYSKNTKN